MVDKNRLVHGHVRYCISAFSTLFVNFLSTTLIYFEDDDTPLVAESSSIPPLFSKFKTGNWHMCCQLIDNSIAGNGCGSRGIPETIRFCMGVALH